MPIVAMPDGAQVSFPDEMPSDQIRSLILQKFPDAATSPPPTKGYFGTQHEMATESLDQLSKGVNQLGSAFKFAASGSGRNRDQMAPEQLSELKAKEKQATGDIVGGFGNTVFGGLGYVASPINAALRKVVGEPVEKTTGIPKEVAEFAASFAIPVPKGMGARAPKAAVPAIADLKAASTADYTAVKNSDAAFSPETMTALADHTNAVLKSKGAYEHLAKPVHDTVGLLRTQTRPDELRSTLEALGSIRSDTATEDKVRRAAGIATAEIKQFLARTEPELAVSLEKANANYGAAKRAEKLDQLKEIAGLRTGRAGYGGNAVNNYRQVLSPIAESAIKNNPMGFKPDEIRAINEIVTGTTGTNIARGVGSLSPAKGGIQTGIAIGTGGLSIIPGVAGNKLAAMMTSKQIDRLNELTRKRSPAYQEAVSNAAAKYFDAAELFITQPSNANFVRSLAASRALAAGLQRDGISISSGDLLRSIRGPVSGAADGDEPSVPRVPGE